MKNTKVYLIIAIVIIFLSLSYLFYIYHKERNTITEGFDDPFNVQRSLSTYYLNNPIDRDIPRYNNSYNYRDGTWDNVNIDPNKVITGYWQNNGNTIFMTLLQNNDQLIMSINTPEIANDKPYGTAYSYGVFNQGANQIGVFYQNSPPSYPQTSGGTKIVPGTGTVDSNTSYGNTTTPGIIPPKQGNLCPYSSMLGVCQLNIDRTNFYLKNIQCNNLPNDSLKIIKPSIYTVWGEIQADGKITLLYQTTSSGSTYIRGTFIKNTADFNCDIGDTWCGNLSTSGNLLSYTNNNFVTRAKPVAPTKIDSNNYNVFMTFLPASLLHSSVSITGNQTSYSKANQLCDLANKNLNDKTVYLCYVEDFVNVYSLGYQFWGTGKGNSSLILQKNYLSGCLENVFHAYFDSVNESHVKSSNVPQTVSISGLASSTLYNVQLVSSFTAEIYDNTATIIPSSGSVHTPITNLANLTFTGDYSAYTYPVPNANYPPQNWQMLPSYDSSSCFLTLKAMEQNYQVEKYVQFNNDGSVEMVLDKDGTNQEFMIEDFNFVQPSNANFIMATGLLRSTNGFYLSPNYSANTLQGDRMVSLVKTPPKNGKWLIIAGSAISRVSDITTIYDNSMNTGHNSLKSSPSGTTFIPFV